MRREKRKNNKREEENMEKYIERNSRNGVTGARKPSNEASKEYSVEKKW